MRLKKGRDLKVFVKLCPVLFQLFETSDRIKQKTLK